MKVMKICSFCHGISVSIMVEHLTGLVMKAFDNDLHTPNNKTPNASLFPLDLAALLAKFGEKETPLNTAIIVALPRIYGTIPIARNS